MNKKPIRMGPKIRITRPVNRVRKLEEGIISAPRVVDERSYIYTCQYCGLKFSQNSHFFRHMTSNHENQQRQATFQCNECQLVFTKKAKLDTHCQTQHQTKSKSRCEMCSITFKSRYCLRRHLKIKQLMQENSCLKCQKKFLCKEQLTKHIENKHTFKNIMFQCDLCSLKFKVKGSLVTHLNRIHKKL
ncbi:zinc finger protein 26-like [Achroia grisella]|uniref:zinc finger protein 26-like n=1 Tax=Achroia grisella TaxID=688607 RepID=UPI0027D200FF|nr:zinc finger protein 26-like [Achroia grisella]